MNKVLLDCDGVLLDWVAGFKNWLQIRKNITPKGDCPNMYDMAEWIGAPTDQVMKLINEFNTEAKEFGDLPAEPGAQKFLETLRREHELIIISSCSDNPNTVYQRERNLMEAFGDIFADIILVPLGQSKADHLKKFERSLWVEDSYSNGLLGLELGHEAVMVRKPYNIMHEGEHPDMRWVDTVCQVNYAPAPTL